MLLSEFKGGSRTKHGNRPGIPLPVSWLQHARSAILHVISLAQFALAYTRGWAVNSQVPRVRLKAENDRLWQQVAMLTEEIRIKDARMQRIDVRVSNPVNIGLEIRDVQNLEHSSPDSRVIGSHLMSTSKTADDIYRSYR